MRSWVWLLGYALGLSACAELLELERYAEGSAGVGGGLADGGAGPGGSGGGDAVTSAGGSTPACEQWSEWSTTVAVADTSINSDQGQNPGSCAGADHDGAKLRLAIGRQRPEDESPDFIQLTLVRFLLPTPLASSPPAQTQARLVLPRDVVYCSTSDCAPGQVEARVMRNDWAEQGSEPATYCRRATNLGPWDELGASGAGDVRDQVLGQRSFDNASDRVVIPIDTARIAGSFVDDHLSLRLATNEAPSFLPVLSRESDATGPRLEYRTCLD